MAMENQERCRELLVASHTTCKGLTSLDIALEGVDMERTWSGGGLHTSLPGNTAGVDWGWVGYAA